VRRSLQIIAYSMLIEKNSEDFPVGFCTLILLKLSTTHLQNGWLSFKKKLVL
jgi:hypothetical protein